MKFIDIKDISGLKLAMLKQAIFLNDLIIQLKELIEIIILIFGDFIIQSKSLINNSVHWTISNDLNLYQQDFVINSVFIAMVPLRIHV
jgi:hypothetical protein